MKEGWEVKKLSELVNIRTGKLNANAMVEGGQYPFFTCSREVFSIDRYAFDCEAILLAGNNASGDFNVKYYKGKFNAYQRTYVITVNENKKVLYSYLNHQLVNNLEKFKEQSVGANTKFLKLGMIQGMEIPLPPLYEQQRIVAILDEAFAAIATAKANTEQNLKNAKELFENYLQSVFENKGEDWEEKRLREIATFRNGMNFSKASRGERIKIVGVKDFQNAFFVPEELLDSVTIEGQLNENDVLKEGDILAVRSNGNPELIGRTILAGGISENTSHSGFTIRIRLDPTVVSPIYICHFLKTKRTRRKLIDGGNGINIKSLNQGTLSSLLITFPKSLTEQQAIVQKLDELSAETKKLEAIYQKKIDDLEEMKKSILQKAFSGQLSELGLGRLEDDRIKEEGVSAVLS